MSIFLWMLIGFAVYSFALVPVLMELALDRKKRTKNGEIRIKRGFVIGNFYKQNFLVTKDDKDYPKDLCQFYRGMYVGPLWDSLVVALVVSFWALLYVVAIPFAIIVGYMPQRLVNFNLYDPFFHEYERIGNKKWIAPWKFIVLIGLSYLIYRFHGEIYQGLTKIYQGLTKGFTGVLPILSSKVAIIVYGSIAGLIFLIILINKIRKTESFVASREVVGSFFKKFCKKIELT